jgi:hypothetical protein
VKATHYAVTFDRKTHADVACASIGGPTLQTWLNRIAAIKHPALPIAISGIWCGRSGTCTVDIEGSKSMLCVGWHDGRVEWSYLS